MHITIAPACREQAPEIARLIMTAMTDECCLHFCADGYGLDDFHRMMTLLVERDDTQYSYRNTFVAVGGDVSHVADCHLGRRRLACNRSARFRACEVLGIAVSYDGGKLHALRQPFIDMAKTHIGKDHTGMDDETQAGELYLDSLAVLPEYRRMGIARRLIQATKEKADRLHLPHVGLLVDKGNHTGEAFYHAVGFRYVGDSQWGGHPMKHQIL